MAAKRRAKRSVRSRSMVAANPNITDNGYAITQANSLGPCCKLFVSCEESGAIASLTDIVSGNTFLTDGVNITLAEGDEPGVSVQIYAWSGGATDFDWPAPGTSDCLLFVCGQARMDAGDDNPDDYGGFFSIYMGGSGAGGLGQLKVQPYYAVFSALGTAGHTVATPFYYPMKRRVAGTTYSFAAAKTGNYLQHYASQGLLTGQVDVSQYGVDISYFSDFDTPGNFFACSHGAYNATPVAIGTAAETAQIYATGVSIGGVTECGEDVSATVAVYADVDRCDVAQGVAYHGTLADGQYTIVGVGPNGPHTDWDLMQTNIYGRKELPGAFTLDPESCSDSTRGGSGTGEYAQNYYGIGLFVFSNGLPSDVPEALAWMEDQWSAGNKVIWPGWSTLT